MKKILGIICGVCIAVAAFSQQDPQYSLYMFNQIGINPAYAGSRDALSANLLYRSQWTSFPGAPKTAAFNIHAPLKNDKIGIGIQFVNDQLGPRKTNTLLTTYAYRMHVGSGRLCLGLSAGIIDQVIDFSKVEYKDLTDVYATMGSVGKVIPTFDFGIYYYTKGFYAGYSITHINQPVYGTVKDSSKVINAILRSHNFLTLGKVWAFGENLVFRPSLMVKFVGGAPASLDLDASFIIRKTLWLGVAWRSSGAIIAIVQYKLTDRLKLGYAYDMTLGGLKNYAGASHEIFLGYDFDLFHSKSLSPRYF